MNDQPAKPGKRGGQRDTDAPAIILASASSARAELLRGAGVTFTTETAGIDEPEVRRTLRAEAAAAPRAAATLAELKAMRVSRDHPGALVIGADQILEFHGQWLAKPGDQAGARRDLGLLRGKMHMQVSAVCVVRDQTLVWQHTETARLTMRDFSDDFIKTYLDEAGDGVLVVPGAYRLEGLGAQLFVRVDGDYFTILGLPLLPLLDFLRGQGIMAR
jgi:septum formation protein